MDTKNTSAPSSHTLNTRNTGTAILNTSDADAKPIASSAITELKAGTTIKATVVSSVKLDQQTVEALAQKLTQQLRDQTNKDVHPNQTTRRGPLSAEPKMGSALSSNANAGNLLTLLHSNSSATPKARSEATFRQSFYASHVLVGRQAQLMVTPIALPKGQSVVIDVLTGGRLNLNPSKNPHLQQPPPASHPREAQPSKETQLNAGVMNKFGGNTRPALTVKQVDAITHALKTTLPNQVKLHTSLNVLSTILGIVKADTQGVLGHTGQSIRTALTPIINQPLSLHSHLKASQIQQAIKTNGMFLESNFHQVSKVVNEAQHIVQGQKLANQDLKGLLLQAENAINLKESSLTPSLKSTSQYAVSELAKLLQLNAITAQQSLPATSQELIQKLVTILLAATNNSIAKIRSLQMQQLLAIDSQNTDGARLAPPLALELPIKVWDSIFPLSLNIFEKWKHEDEEATTEKHKKNKKKQSYWTMFMEFELEKLGKLAAEVKIFHGDSSDHSESVSTRLWAEKKSTRDIVQQRISRLKTNLEKNGLAVGYIECSPNQPPETKPVKISQSLIDITT